MSSLFVRRLALLAAAAIAVLAVVFVLPAVTPDGSKDAFPTWRSVDGVPVVDELPGSFVGVLRVARERNSEQARTSIVLAPGPAAPCAAAKVTIGPGAPFVQEPDAAARANDCASPRLIELRALPGRTTIELGDDTWTLDPSIRDPRSCQLGRDRTCAYWLLDGGRFADPIESGEERVQSSRPEAAPAVSGDLLGGDAARVLLCAAAASPRCA